MSDNFDDEWNRGSWNDGNMNQQDAQTDRGLNAPEVGHRPTGEESFDEALTYGDGYQINDDLYEDDLYEDDLYEEYLYEEDLGTYEDLSTTSVFSKIFETAQSKLVLSGIAALIVVGAVMMLWPDSADKIDTSADVLPPRDTIPSLVAVGEMQGPGQRSSGEPLSPPEELDFEMGSATDRNSQPAPSEIRCDNRINVEPPGSGLASQVANGNTGTCYFLANGSYQFSNVVPKDGMTFLGESTGGVTINGQGSENAFHGTADGVTIARMTFDGFDDPGGVGPDGKPIAPQEQAPIRGTSAIWKSDRGQMATNWLVDSIVSQNNYASGLFVGSRFTVRNSKFLNNGVTGISGDHIEGGLIEFNEISGNGIDAASGVIANGGGIKLTQAGTPQAPVVIANNTVHNNQGIGIWGDIACDHMQVVDNVLYEYEKVAITLELCRNGTISGNEISRSTTTGYAAISIADSKSMLVERNQIDVAKGVIVLNRNRPHSNEGFLSNYDPAPTYESEDITIRNNQFSSKLIQQGLWVLSGGDKYNEDTIRFTNNQYESPESVNFDWKSQGTGISWSAWQAAGRG